MTYHPSDRTGLPLSLRGDLVSRFSTLQTFVSALTASSTAPSATDLVTFTAQIAQLHASIHNKPTSQFGPPVEVTPELTARWATTLEAFLTNVPGSRLITLPNYPNETFLYWVYDPFVLHPATSENFLPIRIPALSVHFRLSKLPVLPGQANFNPANSDSVCFFDITAPYLGKHHSTHPHITGFAFESDRLLPINPDNIHGRGRLCFGQGFAAYCNHMRHWNLLGLYDQILACISNYNSQSPYTSAHRFNPFTSLLTASVVRRIATASPINWLHPDTHDFFQTADPAAFNLSHPNFNFRLSPSGIPLLPNPAIVSGFLLRIPGLGRTLVNRDSIVPQGHIVSNMATTARIGAMPRIRSSPDWLFDSAYGNSNGTITILRASPQYPYLESGYIHTPGTPYANGIIP